MKNLFSLLIISLFSLSAIAGGTDEVQIKTSAICGMCKKSIERNLTLTKGVKEAKLDLSTKIVTVKYNAKKTSPDKIKNAIVMTGYNADDVKRDTKAYNDLEDCCKGEKCETDMKH